MGSDVALALSALLPWTAMLFYGLVIRPLELVSPSLFDAYNEIAPAWGTVASLPISLLLGLIAASFAAWRVSRPQTWALDGPFSVWRTVKWALALFTISSVLALITPGLLSIRLGKIVTGFFEIVRSDDYFDPWNDVMVICIGAGLLMFCVDAAAQTRFKPASPGVA
ncbi:hypothetical protein DCE94_02130 [Agromyces badenianii]|nr:hypothetical protein DCE94_02130 [Agromyces badenianii]